MKREILELREVITKLVPMLTGKGLVVTQRGAQAYVAVNTVTKKPERVNIPSIPDEADPEFISAIQGFIDHEVAHVLITNFDHYLVPNTDRDPKAKRLQNICNMTEDTMIEREICKIFPGSHKNIADLRIHYVAKIAKPYVERGRKELAAGKVTHSDYFSGLLILVLRALAGHVEFQRFMDDEKLWDDKLVAHFVKTLPKDVLNGLPKYTTTKECRYAAEVIERILYSSPPPKVTAVDPAEGHPKGGNEVTIFGDNFTDLMEITFGSAQVIAFKPKGKQQIVVKAPKGTDGTTVDVTVKTSHGSSTLRDAYSYVTPPPPPPSPKSKSEDQDKDENDQDDQDDENESSEGESQDKPEKEAGEGDGDGERDHSEQEDGDEGKEKSSDGKSSDGDEDEAEDEDQASGSDDGNDDDAADEEDGDDPAEGGSDDEAGDDDKDEEEDGKGSADDEGDQDDDGADEDADGGSESDDDEDADGDDAGAGGDDEKDEDQEGEGDADGDADESEGDEDNRDAGNGGDEEQDDASGSTGADGDEDQGAGEEEDDQGGAAGGSDDDDGDDAGAKKEKGSKLTLALDDREHDAGFSEESESNDMDGGGGVGSGGGKSMFEFTDDAFDEADLGAQIAILITNEAVKSISASDYVPYTREFDRIEPLKIEDEKIPANWIPRLDDETRQMTGRIQKDIERMLAAQSRVFDIAGQRRGRLNAPSLHRLQTGDVRVFSRREEIKAKDTAVSLLIDNSGSMKGTKVRTAMVAGYALAQTLERVKIPCEVLGFTTGDHASLPQAVQEQIQKHWYGGGGASGPRFQRYWPIVMPVYKAFDERINAEVKKRIAFTANAQKGLQGNIDGESLEYAAIRLAKRKEKRKVIFVLSDGHPAGAENCDGHLKLMVDRLTKAGFDLIGIGIEDSSVRDFYPKHMVLHNVADLPAMVMTELRKVLQ